MKRTKFALIIALSLGFLVAALYYVNYHLSDSPIYLAIMVPGEQSSLKSTQRAITSVQMYVDEVNANGGISGRSIELDHQRRRKHR